MSFSNRLMGLNLPDTLAALLPGSGAHGLISILGHTTAELAQRDSNMRALIRGVYYLAVHHLGPTEARAAWEAAAKARPGRRKGTSNASRDAELLKLYDSALPTLPEKMRRSLPRYIALFLKETDGQTYFATPASIEKLLRRLLKQREAKVIASGRHAQSLAPGGGLINRLAGVPPFVATQLASGQRDKKPGE